MNSNTIHTLVSAAEADYRYWNSIQESSEAIHISRATAFYVRFIEKIINGLNAIYSYHHAEVFVGRFLARKHFFSLREEELPRFCLALADEMVASGNSPNGQYDRQAVIGYLQEKAVRWHYLLDGYETRQFRRYKETIADIIAYDLTTVFYPSNLDQALLYSYASQFDFVHTQDSILVNLGTKLGLDQSFLSYLIFFRHMPEDWEERGASENSQSLDHAQKVIYHANRSSGEMKRTVYTKTAKKIKTDLRDEMSSYSSYRKVQARVETMVKTLQGTEFVEEDIPALSQAIAQELSRHGSFPSNQYAEDSVEEYTAEKLRRWYDILDQFLRNRSYRGMGENGFVEIMTHDILRGFYDGLLERQLLNITEHLSHQDRNIFLVIAGTALKFSDPFVKYEMFRQHFSDWDSQNDMQAVRSMGIQLDQANQMITETYHRFKKLPKSQYNRLTKAFTSYYTIKKIIELYYESLYSDSYTNPEERIDGFYRRYVGKKGKATEPNEQVRGLVTRIQRNSERIPEDEYDEILFYFIQSDMAKQKSSSFSQYLEQDANREKLQALVFQRYDEFVFKRIMNRNYGGLANLFGTKGFIILIEAYLIGSGVEYVLNHTIEYFVKNGAGVIAFFRDLFFSTNQLVASSYLQQPEHPLVPETFDFSLAALSNGWGMIDWGKTALSLFIPIMFMMLITLYNFIFHSLNRRRNRQKSFQALKNTTRRWLTGTQHMVSFSRKKGGFLLFEIFRIAILVFEVYGIIWLLAQFGFEPTQIGLFFFLLTTICLSAYQGNKLKEEVTLGQSEMITDTIRDIVFIPILEIGRFLSGSAKSVNFIPWLVREGVEPLYKPVVMFLQSFINFQREKKEELI